MLLSGNIPLESPLVPGSSGPEQTFLKKRSKTLNEGFAKMAVFDQNGTAGPGRYENHPKTRFFAPYSSTRRDQGLPTMGMGRVPTPTWVVDGELLVPPGWRCATSLYSKKVVRHGTLQTAWEFASASSGTPDFSYRNMNPHTSRKQCLSNPLFKPEARAGGSLRLPHGLPDV